MSYLNRVWMAATVAAVGYPDQGWKSSLKSLNHGKRTVFSGVDGVDIQTLSAPSRIELFWSWKLWIGRGSEAER
ncbi:hypothetical protein OIU76_015900 [Salix suchowensis]|nr:hypothetical protein OIU76_015900 [Salix suchowensis]